ncbi:MAG: hypothetical protein KGP14_04640 [Betaproteobacteria bacterium]|nr:hypothetical protein [Betaproteobacteria bacterium]
MVTRIRYLPIEDVASGMVLGAPLAITELGVTTFTLPAGHQLTDSNMTQIAQRNAEWACIEEDDPRSDEQRAADQQATRAYLHSLFGQADGSRSAIVALCDAVLRYRSL